MFWSDLDVMKDLGFPQTAARIREELAKSRNSDNIVQWAWDNGFSVERYNQTWYVRRTKAPQSNDTIAWHGSILKDVINQAIEELNLGLSYE